MAFYIKCFVLSHLIHVVSTLSHCLIIYRLTNSDMYVSVCDFTDMIYIKGNAMQLDENNTMIET